MLLLSKNAILPNEKIIGNSTYSVSAQL